MAQETEIIASPPRSEHSTETAAPKQPRRGAIGKALIVWLATGSLGAAVVAFVIFWAIGC